MSDGVRGTAGYAQNAAELAARYDALSFEAVHGAVLHLVPGPPARVLDVGAGSGRDAAYLARRGLDVVAVEPVDALRSWARRHHRDVTIEWVDDALPELRSLAHRREHFDLIMMTAVWMHLDGVERPRAMQVVASLLSRGGALVISLRHGPPPGDRVMHDVSASETIGLATSVGLALELELATPSTGDANKLAGVSWTRLAFRK